MKKKKLKNEKIAETSNEENEISYETIVNHNDTTEESIKESNIITETSDEEFKVTAEIKNKKIDNENEIKEDSTIIKEKIEENEIPTIDTMMDEFDKKVYEIMNKLNIKESTQKKVMRLDYMKRLIGVCINAIIEQIEEIDKEKELKNIIGCFETKENEELNKISDIRYKMLKKLKIKTDKIGKQVIGIVPLLYALKKIGREESNTYKNLVRLLEII